MLKSLIKAALWFSNIVIFYDNGLFSVILHHREIDQEV